MKRMAQQGLRISRDSSPFLDKLFDLPGSKPPHNYATPATPISKSPSDVRGVPRIIVQDIFLNRMFFGHPIKLENQFMRMVYFPPWHPMAAARTTRPAVAVTFTMSSKFNGKELPGVEPVRTFGTAVMRYRAKTTLKRLFMEIYNQSGTDGLYVMSALRVPESKDFAAIKSDLQEYMQLVRNTPPRWSTAERFQYRPSERNFAKLGLPLPPKSEIFDWD